MDDHGAAADAGEMNMAQHPLLPAMHKMSRRFRLFGRRGTAGDGSRPISESCNLPFVEGVQRAERVVRAARLPRTKACFVPRLLVIAEIRK